MKKLFSHHYTCEFEDILNKSRYVVIDTNILLDFYRLKNETIEQLLKILDNFKDKLWIPYHVAYEYHEKHGEVISKQSTIYTQRSKTCLEHLNVIKKDYDNNNAHPYLDPNQLKKVSNYLTRVSDLYKELSDKVFKDGYVRYNNIADIFEDKVNTNDIDDIIKEVPEEAKVRKEKGIPLNIEKKYTNPYGDLIIWKEILKYCGDNGDTVFLTNDKEWFLEIEGKTICPHPYLRKEYRDVGGHNFYVYKLRGFIENFQTSSFGATLNPDDLDISKLLQDLDYLISDRAINEIESSETTCNQNYDLHNTGSNADNATSSSPEKGASQTDQTFSQTETVISS